MKKSELLEYVDSIGQELVDVSQFIWENPEISCEEKLASEKHREVLEKYDFKIHEIEGPGVEYSFYGEYGSGRPVIALLGEYDALPGLSQSLEAKHDPIVKGGPGHGCGHNLLGTGSLGAALALKEFLDKTGGKGTIRYYGCPEEERLSGKVEMIRNKAFENCDLALTWHPMTSNVAVREGFLANRAMKFNFYGISSHAAQSPESGRSALDSVEIMNVGANYLREHVIESARIHYTITNGGVSPNIVPKEASSWYFVRAPHMKDVNEITERLIDVAKGAALMNGTKMDYEMVSGCYELLPNDVMHDLTNKNLKEVGAPDYTEEELKFAKELQDSIDRKTVEGEIKKLTPDADPDLLDPIYRGVLAEKDIDKVKMTGSSDCGDVSWIMPMNFFLTAAWPLGAAPHTWQAAAASGSALGHKGMIYASKVMAAVGYDLLTDEKLVDAAIEEFEKRTKNNKYVCPMK